MLTITHEGNGYKIKLSWPGTGTRGHSVHAQDVDEIKEAIDHYYMHDGHARRQPVQNCPLCRATDRRHGGSKES